MLMKDLRQYGRWQVAHEARCIVEGSLEHCVCHLKELSLKGAQIVLKTALPENTSIRLTLALSKDCVIRPEAWVVWHRAREGIHTHGVYFTRVCDADKEKMYRFLREHFPDEVNRRWFADGAPTHIQGGEIMDDRRVFARFPVTLALKYLEPMRNQEGDATVTDMSAKGVGIITTIPFQPNTALEMWVNVPTKKDPFYSRGEVVWTKMIAPNQYQSGVSMEKANFMSTGAILREDKQLR